MLISIGPPQSSAVKLMPISMVRVDSVNDVIFGEFGIHRVARNLKVES